MNITCAIIDDEPLALNLLRSYVERTPGLKLEGVYSSAVEAIGILRERPVQLVLADIQMPELDGLAFSKMLPATSRVIFTTAFSQYALDSYKLNALDYLLKPISYQDFLTAVNKAADWFEMVERAQASSADETFEGSDVESLFVKSDYKLLRIRFDDILYIEGLKDYVKIHTASQPRPILSLASMKSLEEHLPGRRFLRIHRSFIVNMEKVDVVERGQIVFGDRTLPISDSYRDSVMAYIEHRLP